LKSTNKDATIDCVKCLIGKMPRFPAPPKRTSEISAEILDLVHADLVGPIEPKTTNGKEYVLELMDDTSRWQWHILLRDKKSAAAEFKIWR